jgi:ABC-type transport system involved in cytochrome c biogenesis ATPase subunit
VTPLAQSLVATRRFGDAVAVDAVDLQVEAGEVVGLLGANGAGKTTLIRMLLGLLRPSAGEVMLFGEPPSRDARRRLGCMPQGLGLYDDLSPRENLDFAHAAFGGRRGALPDSLGPLADVTVGALPLGIQRRIAFAQALAHQPDLLVLDEPTSGVDPLARARLALPADLEQLVCGHAERHGAEDVRGAGLLAVGRDRPDDLVEVDEVNSAAAGEERVALDERGTRADEGTGAVGGVHLVTAEGEEVGLGRERSVGCELGRVDHGRHAALMRFIDDRAERGEPSGDVRGACHRQQSGRWLGVERLANGRRLEGPVGSAFDEPSRCDATPGRSG